MSTTTPSCFRTPGRLNQDVAEMATLRDRAGVARLFDGLELSRGSTGPGPNIELAALPEASNYQGEAS
jgi:hypothetical protein